MHIPLPVSVHTIPGQHTEPAALQDSPSATQACRPSRRVACEAPAGPLLLPRVALPAAGSDRAGGASVSERNMPQAERLNRLAPMQAAVTMSLSWRIWV